MGNFKSIFAIIGTSLPNIIIVGWKISIKGEMVPQPCSKPEHIMHSFIYTIIPSQIFHNFYLLFIIYSCAIDDLLAIPRLISKFYRVSNNNVHDSYMYSS